MADKSKSKRKPQSETSSSPQEGDLSKIVDHIDDQLSWMRSELNDLLGQIKQPPQPQGGQVHPGMTGSVQHVQAGPAGAGQTGPGAGIRKRGPRGSPTPGPMVHPGMAGTFGMQTAPASPMATPAPAEVAEPQVAATPSATTGQRPTGKQLREVQPVPRQPPTNVCDEGEQLCIQMELPGVKKTDLDVEVRSDRIIVTGVANMAEISDGEVLFSERQPVEYKREIVLPERVRTKNAKATLEDGVLTLRVGKKEPIEKAEHVKIE